MLKCGTDAVSWRSHMNAFCMLKPVLGFLLAASIAFLGGQPSERLSEHATSQKRNRSKFALVRQGRNSVEKAFYMLKPVQSAGWCFGLCKQHGDIIPAELLKILQPCRCWALKRSCQTGFMSSLPSTCCTILALRYIFVSNLTLLQPPSSSPQHKYRSPNAQKQTSQKRSELTLPNEELLRWPNRQIQGINFHVAQLLL